MHASSKSSSEVRKPPNKRQHKDKTIAMPKDTKANKSSTSVNPELATLEKRLLAEFESMVEIEPLKIKNDQKANANRRTFESSKAIDRKFQQNYEKHRKLQDRISCLKDQLLEKNKLPRNSYLSQNMKTKVT